ncbi:hypothetical protein G3576_21015 [Roseomonas stagni]|uniref:Transposase n=1 Tax=Falsiroseomonas algicola TaxID=2716930 RepID=A0A6M1LQ51_9PROT|nr:hypothetical protein [Falsiroseomonas algicola]NGM22510.1 hypothetical protein [Falsiroseomonas algicola]
MPVLAAVAVAHRRERRPKLPTGMEPVFKVIARLLAGNRWPFRLHAKPPLHQCAASGVFGEVDRKVGRRALRWFFDHAATPTPRNIDRVPWSSGGIAAQHRAPIL